MATVEKVFQGRETNLCLSKTLIDLKDALQTPGRLANNKALDSWYAQSRATAFPLIWSGTGIVYAAPGEKIGSKIQFNRLVFNVPKRYQGMRDIALLLEHPDFRIEEVDGVLTVKGNVIGVTHNFPKRSGLYLTDEFGIPRGKELFSDDSNPELRHLDRADGEYVGAVVRTSKEGIWSTTQSRFLMFLEVIASYDHGGHFNVANLTTTAITIPTEEQLRSLVRSANVAAANLEKMVGVRDTKHLNDLRELVRSVQQLEVIVD
jgi:hypothetical protein